MPKTRTIFLGFGLFAALYGAGLCTFGPKELRFPDAMEYADMARGLARGDGLLDRSIWLYQLSFSTAVPAPAIRRAIGFPLIESLFFRLAGTGDSAAISTSTLFFVLSALLLFALGCSVAEKEEPHPWLAPLAAGVLFLFDPQTLTYATSGLSEPLFTFWVIGLAALAIARPFPGKWLLVGLVAGSSQWIRLNGFTLLLPCLLAGFALEGKKFWRGAALVLAGGAIPLLAMAARNRDAVGIFSFVGINGAIVFNEIAGFSEHGIERRLYVPPEAPPGFLSFALSHFAEYLAKAWRGIDKNLLAALISASPLAWGAAALGGAAEAGRPGRTRALAVFTFSAAGLWVLLFSIGEYEGSRFYVPLVPLVLLIAARAFDQVRRRIELPSRTALVLAAAFALPILLPGWFQLGSLLTPRPTTPYRQRFTKLITETTAPGSIILSDTPWSVAWYGDRTAVWIPMTLAEAPWAISRSGAGFVLLSHHTPDNSEIDDRWKELYDARSTAPEGWKAIPGGPLEDHVALFKVNP